MRLDSISTALTRCAAAPAARAKCASSLRVLRDCSTARAHTHVDTSLFCSLEACEK